MSLAVARNLGRPLQLLCPASCGAARGFATGDKLEADTRTTKPQQAGLAWRRRATLDASP